VSRAEQAFPWLVLASLAVHAALVAGLALAPEGSGTRIDRVQVYTVRIIEAPAPPQARVLALEPPVNSTALAAVPVAPGSLAPPKAVAPPPLGSSAKALRLPAPVQSGDTQVALSPPPLPGAAQANVPNLPAPPGAPPKASAARAPARAPAAEPDGTAPPAAFPAQPLDRLKRKVEQMHLQVEPAPPQAGLAEPGQDSALGLRLFHNAVRERVQKNYSFPAAFAPGLQARVRVVVARDGTQRSAQILQSSGDERFDKLVCLAAIRHSRLPPVPVSVPGDTVTLTLTCSP
jgi:TonB family protein